MPLKYLHRYDLKVALFMELKEQFVCHMGQTLLVLGILFLLSIELKSFHINYGLERFSCLSGFWHHSVVNTGVYGYLLPITTFLYSKINEFIS